MASYTHPDLGDITGISSDSTIQFRGLKYGTLKDRFSDAEIAVPSKAGKIDGTKFGPQVISPPIGCDIEFGFIQHDLPKPDFPGLSDVDGLNLNITLPRLEVGSASSKHLPVVVFFHGGGFAIGANWWPQYDFTALVKLSIELGQPFIGININFRIGVLGFLASEDLTKAGYNPNRGLSDQRTALKWISQYIGGFGGDAENITVMGESAGGLSTAALLNSERPFAKRLICLGGSPPLMRPLPPFVADSIYQSVLQALGVEGKSAEDRVQALLDYPVEGFFAKVAPTLPLFPVIDGAIVPGRPTYEIIHSKEQSKEYPMPGKKWCESLMVGDCKLDASIFNSVFLSRKENIAAAFEKSVRTNLEDSPSTADALLEGYKINEAGISDDEALLRILRFGSDICFFIPAASMAHGFPGKVYLHAFNEPNPWEGPFKGHASHILDVAFLFQKYNEYLDESQKATAKNFAKDVINFVHGVAPYPEFRDEAVGVRIYDSGKATFTNELTPEKTGRQQGIIGISKDVGLDKLLDVWEAFMQGK